MTSSASGVSATRVVFNNDLLIEYASSDANGILGAHNADLTRRHVSDAIKSENAFLHECIALANNRNGPFSMRAYRFIALDGRAHQLAFTVTAMSDERVGVVPVVLTFSSVNAESPTPALPTPIGNALRNLRALAERSPDATELEILREMTSTITGVRLNANATSSTAAALMMLAPDDESVAGISGSNSGSNGVLSPPRSSAAVTVDADVHSWLAAEVNPLINVNAASAAAAAAAAATATITDGKRSDRRRTLLIRPALPAAKSVNVVTFSTPTITRSISAAVPNTSTTATAAAMSATSSLRCVARSRSRTIADDSAFADATPNAQTENRRRRHRSLTATTRITSNEQVTATRALDGNNGSSSSERASEKLHWAADTTADESALPSPSPTVFVRRARSSLSSALTREYYDSTLAALHSLRFAADSVESERPKSAPTTPRATYDGSDDDAHRWRRGERHCRRYSLTLTPYTARCMPLHNDDIAAAYDAMDEWETFDVFALANATHNWPLSFVFVFALSKQNLFHALSLHVDVVFRFIMEIESGYQANPYHNSVHGADVLHAAYIFATQNHLSRHLSALDKFNLFVAAAIHDFAHPGVNNAFLVSSRHPLALTYNDRSVLESYHVAAAFRLMKRTPAANLIQTLSHADYHLMRKSVIDLVVSTDLSMHFDLLSAFKSKIQFGFDYSSAADRSLLLQIVIKAADISHPSRPQRLHIEWAEKLTEEFFRQGDKEKRRGLPQSMFMDRHADFVKLGRSQIGFISFIVQPLFNEFASFIQNDQFRHAVQMNLELWQTVQTIHTTNGEAMSATMTATDTATTGAATSQSSLAMERVIEEENDSESDSDDNDGNTAAVKPLYDEHTSASPPLSLTLSESDALRLKPSSSSLRGHSVIVISAAPDDRDFLLSGQRRHVRSMTTQLVAENATAAPAHGDSDMSASALFNRVRQISDAVTVPTANASPSSTTSTSTTPPNANALHEVRSPVCIRRNSFQSAHTTHHRQHIVVIQPTSPHVNPTGAAPASKGPAESSSPSAPLC